MSPLKCSEYVKSKGVKSLALMSCKSGESVRTLQNWYVSRRYVFNSIVEKVARDEASQI